MNMGIRAVGPDQRLSKPMLAAIGLTIAYLGTMLFLVVFPPPGVFEPKLLLPILNTVFAGALPLAVSFIAIRSYLAGGLNSILLMSSGLMVFGSSAILAGWLIGGTQGPNVNVTLYNVGALLGAVLNALGVLQVWRNETCEPIVPRKMAKVVAVCVAIFLFQLGLTLAVLNGLTPVFFVHGTGPTLLRQGVLGFATTLYLLSALYLFKLFQKESRPFYYWYALSMLMLALGLVAALIQPSVGSSMGWLNRGGHYLAGLYALTAVWATSRLASKKGVSLQMEMTALFQQAQLRYDVLVETVAESIVTTDQDFKITQWNSAAERKFGYAHIDAVGQSLLDLVLTPASAEAFQRHAIQIVQSPIEQPSIGQLMEVSGKSKTSGNLSFEVSMSGVWIKGRWLFVCVFRDSTQRKAIEEAQRKQAEDLLRASETHYHAVVSSMSEAVITHARDGSITSWNAAAERLFGLSHEEFMDRSTLDSRWQVIQEDGSDFLAEMRPSQTVFRTGVPKLNVVMGIYKSDGALRWFLLNTVPIFADKELTPTHVVMTLSDITWRKEAEKASQLSASRLQATLDALPDLMFELNLEGRHCDFHSPRTEFLVKPAKELMGTLVCDVLPANAAATVMSALQEAHVSGYSSGKKYSLLMAKGETWFELSVSRKATDPGEEPRFIVLSRDITDRVHAEQKNFFSALAMNVIGQGVIISNPEGLIISTSKGFAQITGYEESESLSRSCSFLQGPLTDKKTIAAIHQARIKQEVFKGEILNYRKDGSTFWNQISISPIFARDGKLLHIVGALQDITVAKLAEEEVIRSNAEEHRLNSSLSMLRRCDAVIARASDEQQLLKAVCQAITKHSACSMSWAGLAYSVAGKLIQPVAHFGEEGPKLQGIKAAWSVEQTSGVGNTMLAIQTQCTQITKSQWGDPIQALWLKGGHALGPHSVASIPLLNEDVLLGVLVIHSNEATAFDKTEIRLFEDLANNLAFGIKTLRLRSELARHQTKLEELVLDRTMEIEVLNTSLLQEKQEAIAANSAKSDFLSNMSHELRTPLNAVIGLTGLLAQSPLNRRQLDYAEKIQFSANTLRTLIDDILDLSKVEANELHLESAPFSLYELLSNTAAVLGVGVDRKPIEPVLDIAPDVPDALIGDALRVQQILLNLISNAVKFTEFGEIVIRVRVLAGLNALDSSQVTLQFCVSDTGIGMTEETQRLIFNSFTQANESTSRLYGGTGLGLAICTRLTALMQGKLEVQSTLGRGSELCLTLPITLGVETYPDLRGRGLVASGSEATSVLIVDDHALVRDVLTQTCRQLGWQAQAVGSGAAGLQALLNRSEEGAAYDVVLLDWHMPEMDGLAMLRQLRQSPDIYLPPVVLMVATAEIEQAVIASAEFNIDGLIAKPLLPDSLYKAVVNALMTDKSTAVLMPLASPQPFEGLHFLVAEDNELNQEVIEQILISAGAQVTLVVNGQLAVEALEASDVHFDAVLMDVQMPVMDGYTATRQIRETLGLLDLPIIALTAHARPQDREKSRLAGMSGHLVKPLDVQALLDLVTHVVGLRSSKLPTPKTSTHLVDLLLPGLNFGEAVKAFGGNPVVYAGLLSKFMAMQSNDVVEARHRFSSGNSKGAISLLHDLSGVAGMLQALELSRLAATAESAMRDKNTDNVSGLLDELQASMDTIKASIDQLEAALL